MALSPPPVLFLDGEALVIDKPAGLAVTRPRSGGDSLEEGLGALRFGFARPPVIAHRLDRDTSGCLLLARNPKALVRFMAAFAAGEVAKTYLAVVEGVPAAAEGMIDRPLAKVSSREAGWRMVPQAGGKPARTGWRRLAIAGGRALILFAPETGRTHQLRVHAAEGLGLPIVGDPVYGRPARDGLMLHAWRLRLPRPAKPPIEAEAPMPARFAAAGFGPELLDAA